MKGILKLIFAAFLLIAAGISVPALASDSDDLDLVVTALSDSDGEGNVIELNDESASEDDTLEGDSLDDDMDDSAEDGDDDGDSDGDLEDGIEDGG